MTQFSDWMSGTFSDWMSGTFSDWMSGVAGGLPEFTQIQWALIVLVVVVAAWVIGRRLLKLMFGLALILGLAAALWYFTNQSPFN